MIDYPEILSKIPGSTSLSHEEIAGLLWRHWLEDYQLSTPWQVNPLSLQAGSFEYVFDDHENEPNPNPLAESRTIVAHGISSPHGRARDDYRLRGWPQALVEEGKMHYDRGHFIGNAIGGVVDRSEMNLFSHRRDINRGWSEEGKRFRSMEVYCSSNPGVYLFARPIYEGPSASPNYLEYGIRRNDGTLWVETFPN